jgi:hypothetical protein
MEFHKLAKLINRKGNKLFKNVKTRWILMFFPTKRVFVEYRPLNVKMDVESSKSDTILKYLNVLGYWIHSWASMYPSNAWMCVHALIKFALNKDVFVCDFVKFVKLAQQEYINFIVIFMPCMKIWYLMSSIQSKFY